MRQQRSCGILEAADYWNDWVGKRTFTQVPEAATVSIKYWS